MACLPYKWHPTHPGQKGIAAYNNARPVKFRISIMNFPLLEEGLYTHLMQQLKQVSVGKECAYLASDAVGPFFLARGV